MKSIYKQLNEIDDYESLRYKDASLKESLNKRLTEAEEEAAKDSTSETSGQGAEIVDKLKNADYEQFVQILNSDGKSKAFLNYLQNHYKMNDDALGTVKKASASEKVTTCAKLIPTQQNISLKKSFGFLAEGGWSEKVINDPINGFDTPTITYAGTYIIDGHHRWSKVYAIHGPTGELRTLDFPAIQGVSWEDMLKAVQLAIRLNNPGLDLRNKVDNPNMLDDKTGKLAAQAYMKVACDTVIAAMKAKGLGDSKEAQAQRVGQNVATMAKKGAVAGAENREFMPQVDKAPKAETTLKNVGVIDMTEDFDDDIEGLREYWDEECPNGRNTPYCSDPVKPLKNKAPQWYKDQGGSDSSWNKKSSNRDYEDEKDRLYREGWDEEAPLGRHELYPGARVKPMEDNVPQWWKDKGGTKASWDQARRDDHERNKERYP